MKRQRKRDKKEIEIHAIHQATSSKFGILKIWEPLLKNSERVVTSERKVDLCNTMPLQKCQKKKKKKWVNHDNT